MITARTPQVNKFSRENSRASETSILSRYYSIMNYLRGYSNSKIFLLCLTSGIWIKLVGQIYLLEIFLLLLSIICLSQKGNPSGYQKNDFKVPLITLVLAIFGQILSDIYRQSSIINTFKGFSLIFFTLINLYVLSQIVGNSLERAYFALTGFATGILLNAVLQPSIYAQSYPWKFGFGPSITLLILIYASKFQETISVWKTSLLLIFLVIVDFIYEARSLAAWTFLALIVFTLSKSRWIRRRKYRQNGHSGWKNILTLILFSGIFYFLYAHLASNGTLGVDAMQKFQQQQKSNLGLIVAGRSELVSETISISRSPIIGYGSYATLTDELRDASANILHINGIESEILSPTYGKEYLIPVHSSIFEFWLWFGLISILFFLVLLLRYLQSLNFGNLTILGAFISISGIWDIFFTPFAANSRIQIPLYLIYLNALKVRNEN